MLKNSHTWGSSFYWHCILPPHTAPDLTKHVPCSAKFCGISETCTVSSDLCVSLVIFKENVLPLLWACSVFWAAFMCFWQDICSSQSCVSCWPAKYKPSVVIVEESPQKQRLLIFCPRSQSGWPRRATMPFMPSVTCSHSSTKLCTRSFFLTYLHSYTGV